MVKISTYFRTIEILKYWILNKYSINVEHKYWKRIILIRLFLIDSNSITIKYKYLEKLDIVIARELWEYRWFY